MGAAELEADDRVGIEGAQASGDEGGERLGGWVFREELEGDHGTGGQRDKGGTRALGAGAGMGVEGDDHVAFVFGALGKGGALDRARIDDGSRQGMAAQVMTEDLGTVDVTGEDGVETRGDGPGGQYVGAVAKGVVLDTDLGSLNGLVKAQQAPGGRDLLVAGLDE
jgi:hypothetical protein